MSRLTRVFGKLSGVRGRKKARMRAYQSETMAFKMEIVQRETRSAKRRKPRK